MDTSRNSSLSRASFSIFSGSIKHSDMTPEEQRKEAARKEGLVFRDILEIKGPSKCYKAIKEKHPTWPHTMILSTVYTLRDELDKLNIKLNVEQ